MKKPALILHDPEYPSPESLKSLIRVGNIDFEGDMKEDTEGSDFIKQILLDDEEGPVYIQIWGGTNTLARALKSIEEEFKGTDQWKEVYRQVSEKTFIYTILDQDATYTRYLAPNWPDIRVIYNSAQFWSFACMWPRVVPETLRPYMEGEWFSEHIKFGHGPLLAGYYVWGDGTRIEGDPEHIHGDPEEAARNGMKPYDFISEGDSPAYFQLLHFGLRSMEDPAYGGLGGRFVLSAENPKRWEDGRDVGDLNPETGEMDLSYPQIRWIRVLQNDFAARADWCVNDREHANHAPVVTLRTPPDMNARPGASVRVSASVGDPDGDGVEYSWWQYTEPGSCETNVEIEGAGTPTETLTVPENAPPGQTIHLTLQLTDDGTPELTRFARTIITV